MRASFQYVCLAAVGLLVAAAAGCAEAGVSELAGDVYEADGAGPADGGTGGDGSRSGCRSSAECSGDEVCAFTGDSDPVTSCQSPGGGGGHGDDCGGDDECRSRLCRDGTCTVPCDSDDACSDDGSRVCRTESVDGNDVAICVPDDDSGEKQCFTDEDCSAQNKCLGGRGDNGLETTCGSPNQGGGAIGESCEDDSECYRNLCVDGRCTTPCSADDDCPSDSDLVCREAEIELGDDSTATGSVCAPSVTCAHAGDCEGDDVCYIRRSRSDEPGVCRVGNPSGGDLGDVCNADSNCRSNVCYQGRFRKVCTLGCDGNDDCTKPGFNCETTSVADGDGGSREMKICAPTDPTSCEASADCATDEVCAIVADQEDGELERICVPDPGGVATGSSCENDRECKNLVCHEGFCAAPCKVESSQENCANNQICRQATIEKGGNSADFKVCETPPDQECTTTGTCDDGIRVCSELREDNNEVLEAYCRFPNDGGKSLGASCQEFSECKSGLCLGAPPDEETDPVDRCSVACTKTEQCGDNQICTSVPNPDSDLAVCRTPCTLNEDCPDGYACSPNENRLSRPNNTLDTICLRRGGDNRKFGSLCGPSASGSKRCQTDICLRLGRVASGGCSDCSSNEVCEDNPDPQEDGKVCYVHRCSRFCQDGNDCGSGGDELTRCGTAEVELSDGATQSMSVCSP